MIMAADFQRRCEIASIQYIMTNALTQGKRRSKG